MDCCRTFYLPLKVWCHSCIHFILRSKLCNSEILSINHLLRGHNHGPSGWQTWIKELVRVDLHKHPVKVHGRAHYAPLSECRWLLAESWIRWSWHHTQLRSSKRLFSKPWSVRKSLWPTRPLANQVTQQKHWNYTWLTGVISIFF